MNYDHESGTPLVLALTNSDTTQRVATANRLLDDSADVSRRHPLHVLLARNEHDFAAEAPLVERLLDAGVDVNEVLPNDGTPLETLAARFKFSDVSHPLLRRAARSP